MADQQFHLVYQPIIALATGEVHKAEALLRWQHPERGMVSPAAFIPIAESTGLIVDIGDWVFRQAVQQVKHWRAALHPQFQVSVNKSPVQFVNARGSQQAWFDHLKLLGLPGQSVVVEITESLLLEAGSDVYDQLLELRDAGVGVSLDDFGTGYSSLSYLQRYDIDYLKIDQSFVRNLGPGGKDLALCKAIILMAHELGMQVIAEGVETAEQRELLLAAGCDYAQGYLFARPMPVADFEAWCRAQ
jgi:EAL domain-containing protein (putative c-di-GMP-specific phosphodiesterase class I)